jgi:glycine/D-amino acid oxidase-like deaminating enzyme
VTTAPPASVALPRTADAVVIGAGIVGAAVAASLSTTGRTVCVIDRSGPLGGTSAAGEGNILVSDKFPGPELALALRSYRLWRDFAAAHGPGFEFEHKGGVVVAHDHAGLAALEDLADRQRAAGVEVTPLGPAGLRAAEPAISPRLAGGVLYPQDCQVQPMRAAIAFLAEARGHGCTVVAPWGAEVAGALGSAIPVEPRRGRLLVTEPLPHLVRHKVYEADYVATVASDDRGLACSAVVESTMSGTVLVGSSREFAGFAGPIEVRVLAEIARRAISIFPFLGGVRAIRAYGGFRPASPDHLPIIGADAAIPGLYHATGHEGAGVGLAPATAELIAALIDGKDPPIEPAPFAPGRFAATPPAATSPATATPAAAGPAAAGGTPPSRSRKARHDDR